MNLPSVGLDISKSNFHAAILKTLDTKPLVKAFNNNESGFAELLDLLHESAKGCRNGSKDNLTV
jgi:transposase